MAERLRAGAKRLGRGLARQRLLTALAGGTLLYALAWAAFNDQPEWFDRGEQFGELGNDLAVGYLAAWVFNVLVVVLPREREREQLLAVVRPRAKKLAQNGLQLRAQIANAVEADVDLNNDFETPLTEAQIREWAAATPWLSDGPSTGGQRNPDGTIRLNTWHEHLWWVAAKTDEAHRDLMPYFGLLSAEFLSAVEAVDKSSFMELVRTFAPSIPVGGTLDTSSGSIKGFIDASLALHAAAEQGDILR